MLVLLAIEGVSWRACVEIEYEGQMIPVYAGYLPTGQARYSQPFRDYCFSLYVGEMSRSISSLVRFLEDRHRITITPATLYNWRKEDNWEVRARELYQVLRPGLLNDTLDQIVVTARDSVTVLKKMLAGEERPDAVKVKIAFGLIDRAGLMPHSVVADHIRMKVAEVSGQDTSSLSDAELRELEESYQPDGAHLPSVEVPDAQVVLAHQRKG